MSVQTEEKVTRNSGGRADHLPWFIATFTFRHTVGFPFGRDLGGKEPAPYRSSPSIAAHCRSTEFSSQQPLLIRPGG